MRNLEGPTDFYQQLNLGEYTDQEFPVDEVLYWPSDGEEILQNKPALDADRVVFARPEQILDDFTLFGKDGVTEWDVKQGLIGNCWWMAGCIAVSQNPSRI